MLAGIIVNNGIVLIDFMNQLIEGGMSKKEAIMTAGKTRVRPVLMTALTTILALSTMAFSHDMGSEMGKPMAVTTIGGLIYGTLLTLIVVPCVYDIFVKDPKEKAAKKARKLAKKNRKKGLPVDYEEDMTEEDFGNGAFSEAEIIASEENDNAYAEVSTVGAEDVPYQGEYENGSQDDYIVQPEDNGYYADNTGAAVDNGYYAGNADGSDDTQQ